MQPAELARIAKETEELEAKILKGEPIDSPPPEQEQEEKPVTPPAEPAPEPAPKQDPKPEATPPPETPPTAKEAKRVDWEQKYRVLQGKYDAEVPRYAADLRSVNERILALQTENAKLHENAINPPAAPEPATPVTKDINKALDQDPEVQYLKNEYPDVYKAMIKTVNTLVGDASSKVDALEKKIELTNKKVEKSDSDKFYDYLNTNVTGWQTVNTDPKFREWLGEPDRYSGVTKAELIRDAIGRLDGQRTAMFFEDFARENSTPTEEPPRQEPEKPKQTIYPPKGRPTTPPVRPDTVETISAAEIEKFYKDVRRGVYDGKEKERLAAEARIDKAVVERRVTQ